MVGVVLIQMRWWQRLKWWNVLLNDGMWLVELLRLIWLLWLWLKLLVGNLDGKRNVDGNVQGIRNSHHRKVDRQRNGMIDGFFGRHRNGSVHIVGSWKENGFFDRLIGDFSDSL